MEVNKSNQQRDPGQSEYSDSSVDDILDSQSANGTKPTRMGGIVYEGSSSTVHDPAVKIKHEPIQLPPVSRLYHPQHTLQVGTWLGGSTADIFEHGTINPNRMSRYRNWLNKVSSGSGDTFGSQIEIAAHKMKALVSGRVEASTIWFSEMSFTQSRRSEGINALLLDDPNLKRWASQLPFGTLDQLVETILRSPAIADMYYPENVDVDELLEKCRLDKETGQVQVPSFSLNEKIALFLYTSSLYNIYTHDNPNVFGATQSYAARTDLIGLYGRRAGLRSDIETIQPSKRKGRFKGKGLSEGLFDVQTQGDFEGFARVMEGILKGEVKLNMVEIKTSHGQKAMTTELITERYLEDVAHQLLAVTQFLMYYMRSNYALYAESDIGFAILNMLNPRLLNSETGPLPYVLNHFANMGNFRCYLGHYDTVFLENDHTKGRVHVGTVDTNGYSINPEMAGANIGVSITEIPFEQVCDAATKRVLESLEQIGRRDSTSLSIIERKQAPSRIVG